MKSLAVIVAAAAVVVGCGGHPSSSPSTTNPQIIGGLAGLPTSANCKSHGITSRAAREGTCAAGATSITLVNSGHRLRMDEYGVKLAGVRTAETLGSRAAENFQPNGRFVVVSLRVQNPGRAPLRFDTRSLVAYLLVGGQLYPEIPGAEAEVSDSFRLGKIALPPQQSQTGTIVFDPPRDKAAELRARGYLVFQKLNEQQSGPPRVGSGKTALGFIRLWK